MSQPNIDDAAPVPEYELEQYFPERRELSREERKRLRDQHGYLRTYFMTHPESFRDIQRWLNQARFGETYDIYLARSARYALLAGVVGLLVGMGLVAQLLAFDVVEQVATLAGLDTQTTTYALFVSVTLLLVAVFAATTFLGRYYYPRNVVNSRENAIDIQLPHAIVYMYALSHGGMNTFEVFRELAHSEGVYGEVANEFDMIVRDVELFGNDLFTAIRDARNLTPSDNLEQFLDDTLSVLDSGSDFSQFLEGEANSYMDEARQKQDEFLDTLSVLSEVFVVMFVAAPLFLIVTLMVISLLGGESLVPTYLIVYVVMPLAMGAFLVVIDFLSKPYAQNSGEVEIEGDRDDDDEQPPEPVRDHPRYATYEERKRRNEMWETVSNPISHIRNRNPLLSLLLTVPLAAVAVGALVATGSVPTTYAAVTANPVQATIGYFVVPFLVTMVPLTVFYESQRRRHQRIARRFPDTLNILSSANQMGISLTESFDLVSRWSEGLMADELRKVRNDIEWNYDVQRALLSFANRLEVPQVTRTMNLIAKGSRSSSDLAKIISIAAEDTRNRYQIETKRQKEMQAYTAIVIMGFLVYLGVIVLLDTSYLGPIGELSSEAAATANADVVDITQVPVDAYQTVFFHSALIQGIGSGLLAGKLADNDVLAGLKYSLVLVGLTLAVFLFI
ncbi:type II secretion system F family protein [Halorarius litoreus]|uniref:type II secretion system F family protein n=1 Tax=Halorarius litoreus TaxID=2962676 RepID=UPI0020CC5ACA|nr:type II secretion system F family protein [Halorarius litoreus]